MSILLYYLSIKMNCVTIVTCDLQWKNTDFLKECKVYDIHSNLKYKIGRASYDLKNEGEWSRGLCLSILQEMIKDTKSTDTEKSYKHSLR